ncbi:MAG: serine hydrolase [Ignavibacteriae bacterium]|nr:MAG: serine hydrolase [Ignavibacteriota bacterium]
MKKLKYFTFILIMLSISTQLAQDEVTAKLESLMQEYNNMGIFSGVVLLAKDGNQLYKQAFGYADWENKNSNNTSTLFNIASITKLFTRSMIMQLKDEGKLSLDDPLSKYIALYPEETGNKITIQMLIDMKAGLGDYLNNPKFNRTPDNFKSVNDFLEIIKDEPLLFEPGTSQRYSNSGYVVLGGIIEKASGKSYEENLKERIFEPLNMKDSYFLRNGENVTNSAIGAMLKFSGEKVNAKFHAAPSPAGGIFTNADDLLKFSQYVRQIGFREGNIAAGGTPAWNSILGHYNNGYTLIILSNFGKMAEEVELRVSAIINGKTASKPDLPGAMKYYKVIKKNGIAYFKEHFKEMLEQNDLKFNDMHLNFFGYELMESGEIDLAIEVFKYNSELFPGIANVYDSLAEAYAKKGDKELAKVNYKKVLEMEPGNGNAKKMLEELGE